VVFRGNRHSKYQFLEMLVKEENLLYFYMCVSEKLSPKNSGSTRKSKIVQIMNGQFNIYMLFGFEHFKYFNDDKWKSHHT